MTNQVIFKNAGEIDIRAAMTFGMTSKLNENPIGFFGTGLKYAICILLRAGAKVTVWSGEKKYVFKTKKEKTRDGVTHNVVMMNRTRMPFTTDLGKSWVMWQAFRELYSNVLDEDGKAFIGREKPSKDKTLIVVENCEEFTKCYEDKFKYFLEGDPFHQDSTVDYHNPEDTLAECTTAFYRGISVYEAPNGKHFQYRYNLKAGVTLTEDRTVRESYYFQQNIVASIMRAEDKDLIEKIVLSDMSAVEYVFPWGSTLTLPGDSFMEVIGALVKEGRGGEIIPAVRSVFETNSASDGDSFIESPMTDDEKELVQRAYEVITTLGVFSNPKEIKLMAVESLGAGVFGMAKFKKHKRPATIYLSKLAFSQGQDVVTGTIFEELCHLKLHMEDECRDFQNFLINTVARLGTKIDVLTFKLNKKEGRPTNIAPHE